MQCFSDNMTVSVMDRPRVPICIKAFILGFRKQSYYPTRSARKKLAPPVRKLFTLAYAKAEAEKCDEFLQSAINESEVVSTPQKSSLH